MKVVPEDILTCPLGTVREPQLTAMEYEHSGYRLSVHSHSFYYSGGYRGGSLGSIEPPFEKEMSWRLKQLISKLFLSY